MVNQLCLTLTKQCIQGVTENNLDEANYTGVTKRHHNGLAAEISPTL